MDFAMPMVALGLSPLAMTTCYDAHLLLLILRPLIDANEKRNVVLFIPLLRLSRSLKSELLRLIHQL
jgi:hypothetical protein